MKKKIVFTRYEKNNKSFRNLSVLHWLLLLLAEDLVQEFICLVIFMAFEKIRKIRKVYIK